MYRSVAMSFAATPRACSALITLWIAAELADWTAVGVAPFDCTPSWMSARSGTTFMVAAPVTYSVRPELQVTGGWGVVAGVGSRALTLEKPAGKTRTTSSAARTVFRSA